MKLSNLDLCLACKGCTSECPSGVDMPKLKYEFMNQYYKRTAARCAIICSDIFTSRKMAESRCSAGESFYGNGLVAEVDLPNIGIAEQRPFPRFSNRASNLTFKRVIPNRSFSSRMFFLITSNPKWKKPPFSS
jgi:Fe-S oxidoreductase